MAGHSQLSLAFSNSQALSVDAFVDVQRCGRGTSLGWKLWVVNVLVKQAHFFHRHDEGVSEVINL